MNRWNYPLVFGKSAHARGKTGFRAVESEEPTEKRSECLIVPTERSTGKGFENLRPDAPILYQLTENGEGNGRETRALARFVVDELKAVPVPGPVAHSDANSLPTGSDHTRGSR